MKKRGYQALVRGNFGYFLTVDENDFLSDITESNLNVFQL
jgi:hypothetical protein